MSAVRRVNRRHPCQYILEGALWMGLMSRGWGAGAGGRNVSSLIRHLITGAEDNGGSWPPRAWFHSQAQPSFVSPARRPHLPMLHTRLASQVSLRWNSQPMGLVTAGPSLCDQHWPILHRALLFYGPTILLKAWFWFPDTFIFRVLQGSATYYFNTLFSLKKLWFH